jgi:ketol-acid reductoisomerase
MRFSISTTAEYGDLTRGPRIISEAVRAEMRRVLDEIQDGRFAKEWIDENANGLPHFNELRKHGQEHQIEVIGAQLREMMPFISAGRQRIEDVSGG